MASGGHSIQLQKGSLETRIKTLVNNDLKEICKAYEYQVSGTKAVLQKRCIEILEDIVSQGDEAGFNVLNYRVSNHGVAPPRSAASSGALNSNGVNGNHQGLGMAPGYPRPQPAHLQHLHGGARPFKSSPFYEVRDTVLTRQELPEMPQNRHTVRAVLALSPDHVKQLRDDTSMRLMLYCGMNMMGASVDVSFPNQLEVKINGDDVKANYKGLKGKTGSTKPADLTDHVRKTPGYQNQLSVTYALTKNKFALVVYLVKRVTADTLAERLRNGGGSISKQTVINEMAKANSDDDIAATSVRMSLKDPISTLRITLPVRSSHCKHNQCFDGSMFLQLQDQAPQWSCPVCNKNVLFESLCIDKYFEEILQKTSSSIEKVEIQPNGEWRVIKDEEDAPPHSAAKAGRAAYDDDFDDDDLVDITDEQTKPTNGALAAPYRAPPMPSPAFPINTPPLSSRDVSRAPSLTSTQAGSKRPASAVIDLTFSDDEDDEPPRSGKRQATSTHNGNSLNPYSTPSSYSDPRSTSFPAGQNHVADSYRPSSNAARPVSNGRTSAADYYHANYPIDQFATRQGTPFRPSASASPGFGAPPPQQSGSSWTAQPPRPPAHPHPTGQPQTHHLASPFAIRHPSDGPPQHGQQGQYNQLRLPPMQTQPQNTSEQWRDFSANGFSSSTPPG